MYRKSKSYICDGPRPWADKEAAGDHRAVKDMQRIFNDYGKMLKKFFRSVVGEQTACQQFSMRCYEYLKKMATEKKWEHGTDFRLLCYLFSVGSP